MHPMPNLRGWLRLDWMEQRHYFVQRVGPLLYQALCGQQAYMLGNIYIDRQPKCPHCLRLLRTRTRLVEGTDHAIN